MTILDNRYKLYVENTVELVRSLVLKSKRAADAMNEIVTRYHGINSVLPDPRTWRYYKHLAGEYHFTDTDMMVISADTLETIKFSKETLRVHRATFRAYQYGTKHYKELVARYKDQELLINGILNPTDIEFAINAEPYQILNYQKDLIEVNEYSLLEKIQDYVNIFMERWYNRSYDITDYGNEAYIRAICALTLVSQILVMRQEATNTNEAHSFHVRSFLASHGMLDTYLDMLTIEQALWLYRNIRYINRYAGHTDTFEWLIENILTKRVVPLAEYSLRHDISDQLETLLPKPLFVRTPLNLGYNEVGFDEITLHETLLKEDGLAPDNQTIREFDEAKIQRSFENAPTSVLKTKLLESAMIDFTGSQTYPLENVLLSQWLHAAAKGYYTSVIYFNNPLTGESIPLTVKDAYIFMWYCHSRSYGNRPETFALMSANRVAREPLPSVDELMSVVDPKLVSPKIANAMLALVPPTFPVISTEAFYNQCVLIFKAQNRQHDFVCMQEHMNARAMVQNMSALIYSDNTYRLVDEDVLTDDWLVSKNLNVSEWGDDQFEEAMLYLIREATGASLTTTNSVANIQRAMLGLFTQLSSYSIQLAQSINESTIHPAELVAFRLGDSTTKANQAANLEIKGIEIQKVDTEVREHADLELCQGLEVQSVDTQLKTVADFVFAPVLNPVDNKLNYTQNIQLSVLNYKLLNPIDLGETGHWPLPGVDDWLKLPYTERNDFEDMFGNVWGPAASEPKKLHEVIYRPFLFGLLYRQRTLGKPPLSSLIVNTDLNGFAPVVKSH